VFAFVEIIPQSGIRGAKASFHPARFDILAGVAALELT
jgi:hypothetical protein